jgi:hypothetical protein
MTPEEISLTLEALTRLGARFKHVYEGKPSWSLPKRCMHCGTSYDETLLNWICEQTERENRPVTTCKDLIGL